jgi:hypothetical protein
MQQVDAEVLDVLIDRFHALDSSGEGALDIGDEVPSAADMKEMQTIKAATGSSKPLMDMWADLCARRQKTNKKKKIKMSSEVFTRVNACHDFAWSRQLWKDAARQSGKVSLALLAVYLALAFGLLAGIERMRFVDALYFIVATITTVQTLPLT